jgi:hypothetical protein
MVFFWFLFKGLSTRNLLKKKNMILEDYNCVLCNLSTEESLFISSSNAHFQWLCWGSLGLVIPQLEHPFHAIASFINQLRLPFFMEVIITMCWARRSFSCYRFFHKSASSAFLYGSDHHHVLC